MVKENKKSENMKSSNLFNPLGLPASKLKNNNPLSTPTRVMFYVPKTEEGIHKSLPVFDMFKRPSIRLKMKTDVGHVVVRIFGRKRYLQGIRKGTIIVGNLYPCLKKSGRKLFNGFDILLSEKIAGEEPKTLRILEHYLPGVDGVPNPKYQGGAVLIN